jgi:glucan-binding YG repeat protein
MLLSIIFRQKQPRGYRYHMNITLSIIITLSPFLPPYFGGHERNRTKGAREGWIWVNGHWVLDSGAKAEKRNRASGGARGMDGRLDVGLVRGRK